MRLGIMVTTDRHLAAVRGIALAALGRGHTVEIFATDEGVRLLADPAFTGLADLPGAAVAYCDLSARVLGVATAGLPAAVRRGSQLENAGMQGDADKVIAL